MWKILLVSFLIVILCLGFLTPASLKAYTLDIEDLLGSTTLDEIAEKLVDLVFKVSLVLVPIMIVFAAFLFVTAAGNAEKVAQAKRLITWALIGFIVALLSRGIIVIIKQLFGLK